MVGFLLGGDRDASLERRPLIRCGDIPGKHDLRVIQG